MKGTQHNRRTAFKISLCGMITALSVILMIAGGALGVMTYAAPLLAAALLIPVIYEIGNFYALLVYASSCVLSLLICADKELAFFYVFTGYYPILRPYFNAVRSTVLRIVLKLLLFCAATGCMYALLYFVFGLEQLKNELSDAGTVMNALLFAGLVLIMLIYDRVLVLAERLYIVRLRPRLKFLNRS